jgi:hypothetical protein
MRTISNVRVGRPDVKATAPSHVWGIRQGNAGLAADQPRRANRARGDARRSTGINARARAPIDPRMPNLSPQ